MTDLHALLKSRFGFEQFRPKQEESIKDLFQHRRILCIQPTGHGKSLLYQLPSLMLEGMTLVISPLLALVRDQHNQLRDRFQVAATAINSDQTIEENDQIKEQVRQGAYKILFIAPEQLDNLATLEFLLSLPISLLVVDEAHCISTWGHDFRPSYRQIVKAVQKFEAQRDLLVLGLTATADHKTEQDIAAQLASPTGEPLKINRHSMDRPNLALSCLKVRGVEDKLEYLEQKLKTATGFGLLYCSTREQTEIVSTYLQAKGLHVASYHAGYSPEKKIELQSAMMQGSYQAIASTNALGMGIDKQDIRYVIHVDLPASITAYYQEVGRAGRDGEDAQGVLLFDKVDRKIQDYFISNAEPSADEFDIVIEAIEPDFDGNEPGEMAIKVRTGLHPTKVKVILAELIDQGIVEKKLVRRKQVYTRLKNQRPVLNRFANQRQVRMAELEKIIQYGERKTDCLMAMLRQALGDEIVEPCGRCSLCLKEKDTFAPALGRKQATEQWLLNRDVTLPAKRTHKISEGIAIFNGETRTTPFINFMKNRSGGEALTEEVEEILRLKIEKTTLLKNVLSVLVVPSNSWQQRMTTGKRVAELLGVPLFADMLIWAERPERRQGELHNNDQRKENVNEKMTVAQDFHALPSGNTLLIDDYIGSGHTLSEACRVLRKEVEFSHDIIPLIIARIRWKLGASGMI
ncbi:MAG: RecQ family ATP-dependent DNA helicase [Candidatus Latescibacterota bacterium]